MRQETTHDLQETAATAQDAPAANQEIQEAFQYLKSLPNNNNNRVLDSYRRGRNFIVPEDVAEYFTGKFRNPEGAFYIPIAWSMSKSSLINLLGITEYTGHAAVSGVRFYAGLNDDDQLTLIAVSTTIGTGCHDDLTVGDSYPYYDYASPCPYLCTTQGSLKATTPTLTKVEVVTE